MRFVLLMLLDLLPLLSAAAPRQEAVPLRPGMVISSSVKIARRGYLLPSGDETGKSGAVIVRGSDLTVDFNGAELRGTSSNTAPNERKGTGLLIEGRNITLKNLRVQGYKIGLFARHCVNLRLLGGDASFNWKQRLGSTREREDESDWQSYHHNENDEWLRYGAALYLRDCDRFEVKGVTVQGGQCGLMLVNSSHGKVWNCDFSFLSGVGLGLYRACDNQVLHNRIDFCVRGFSYGVYNRGQDSAGILVYEQSSRNTFAYNSATHGGDGFFLWAGQSTMDTGQGGCSDNLVYGNDFSYAPANGIEATFSRNRFVNNRAAECDYGLWGGYSFDTLIQANQFYNNRIGIAIEHGQHNKIEGNVITGGDELISLWQNASQDPNWSYPKHHDTVSHDYVIRGNTLALPARVALRLRSTREVRFTDNTSLLRQGQNLLETANVDGLLSEHNGAVRLRRNRAADSAGDDLKDLAAAPFDPLPRRGALPTPPLAGIDAPAPFQGGIDPFVGRQQWRGQRYIYVDEWGPYDFRFPRLEPRPRDAAASNNTIVFDLLGQAGKWRVKSVEGVALSASSGTVPGTLSAVPIPSKGTDIRIDLEYVGAEVRDYRGIVTPKGQTVPFGFHTFVAPVMWNVRFFVTTPETDPRDHPDAFRALTQGRPAAQLTTGSLHFAGMGAFAPGVPANHFATMADGEINLPAGRYILEIVSDDGCRVEVDGKRVIDAWHYQVPTHYTAELVFAADGTHKIHVEHFQIDGYATLQLDIKPRP